MKISYNWLKQYLPLDLPAGEVASLLTNCGLEVEGVETFQSVKGGLNGLVIGEVKTCVRHPNADKLSLTTVDTGSGGLLHIVCGAPNVAGGQKVVVALVGTKLYPVEGEPFEIKKSKIRGELSEGMICAEDEIGLGKSHEGIIVLPADAKTGSSVKEFYKVEEDTVFEIGLTPNRADAASHIGVARDLSAVLAVKSGIPAFASGYVSQANYKPAVYSEIRNQESGIIIPDLTSFKIDSNDLPVRVEVIDTNACPRYSGITVSGVEVKESPEWLKNRLLSIGVHPINNIVDITNYVLHECGQPLHAFDADEITGGKVVVRPAGAGEKFVTLDGVERKLSPENLMICNAAEPMCIAGVFGGIRSGITEKTKRVFIESAYFNPASIRKTSKGHGLKTDASFRFERGTDPEATLYALKRAAMFMKELAGGMITSDIVDVYPVPIDHGTVRYDFKSADALIGKKLDRTELKNILASLNISVTGEDDSGLNLTIPTYKVDVSREVDVVEEVLRIYGYNNIEVPPKQSASLSYFPRNDREVLQNRVSDFLSASGFYEMLNNSLSREIYSEVLVRETDTVKIMNPLSQELGVMRNSLLFSGLEGIAYNRNRQHPDQKLYEFGTVYREKDPDNHREGFREEDHLSLFVTGKKSDPSWTGPASQVNFFYLKSFVENVLALSGIQLATIKEEQADEKIFSYGVSWRMNEKKLASFGSVSKSFLKQLDIAGEVFFAEINWKALLKLNASHAIQYRELPRFPQVKRDLSMIIGEEITYRQLRDIAFRTERILLKEVNLFDVYAGDKMESGKKSYALSFILQDERQTLTDKTIDKVMNRLMEIFEKEVQAVIRKA